MANNGYSDKTFSDSMGGKRRSVSGPLIRSAIGCAIACGAPTVGPLVVGSPVAKADLLGVGGGGGVDVLGIKVVGSGESERSGSAAPLPAAFRGPPAFQRRRVHAVSSSGRTAQRRSRTSG